MSIIQDVLAAARGGIKERDNKIASLTAERDGYKTANTTMASDLSAAQQLVAEAAGKEVAYNQAIADYDRVVSHCSSLESRIAASEVSAREFAAEFGFLMGDQPSEGQEPGEGDASPAADVPDDGEDDHEPEAADKGQDASDDDDDHEETEVTVEVTVEAVVEADEE